MCVGSSRLALSRVLPDAGRDWDTVRAQSPNSPQMRNSMAEVCPQCSKKTGMDIGAKEPNGRQTYQCQSCKLTWKK